MKRVLMAVVLVLMAGGVYAADFADLQAFKGSNVKDGSPIVSEPVPQSDANKKMNTAIVYAVLRAFSSLGVSVKMSDPSGSQPDLQEVAYFLGNASGAIYQVKQLMQIAGYELAGVDMNVLEAKAWGLSGYIFPARIGDYMVPTGNRAKFLAQAEEIEGVLQKIGPGLPR